LTVTDYTEGTVVKLVQQAAWTLSLGLTLVAGPVLAQDLSACASLDHGGYGPFDYRTATPTQKRAVESVHFTPEVESLRAGSTSRRGPGGDISYTLGVFPNHPRALVAMMRLVERDRTLTPRGARYSIDCYFERAIRFAPDDVNVRVIFGAFLIKHGKPKAAVEQLQVAEEHSGESGNVSYNLGLAYFDLKDYAKAREYAKRAREQGFTLEGLENKLRRAGQWKD
jgi:tetratricopeptide (TPR) repeat protein